VWIAVDVGQGLVVTRPRDLPCGGEFAVVQWRKRRWRCRAPDDPPTIAARTGNGVGPGLAITTAQGAGAEIFNVAPTTLPMRLAQFV
jgi:hypothetical protein